jgi:hypothetical protein
MNAIQIEKILKEKTVMARITLIESDWTQPNREFAVIRANVDTLMMDVLDNKLGTKYSIKAESITEWIKLASLNDIGWMLWIGENKKEYDHE